jgi:hypothetical protein
VGFLLAEAHPSSLFIVELSVHLDWQGKGNRSAAHCLCRRTCPHVGADVADVDDISRRAVECPFYARLGFERVDALTPELRQKREEEAAHGFAYDSRCAMRLPL